MIRIFGAQFSKVNNFSNQRYETVRKICTSLCVQQRKSKAEEIAERKRKDDRDKEMRWTKLYHFTDMKYHSIVTRLKIYPLITTIIGTPAAYAIESAQIFAEFTWIPTLVFGISGTTTLSMYSAALADTIGLIYICKDKKNLQIGYIDFLGKQHFIETTVEELRKCEKGPVKYGLYKTVRVVKGNTEKKLKIPWNTGDIYDIKMFRRLLGP